MDGLNNLRRSFRDLKWYEWLMAAIMVAVAGYTMAMAFIDPGSTQNPGWLTVINFVSAIAGILCIFFTAKASISCCIFGIINTLAYVVFLAYWEIYGTMCLEVFIYLPFGIIQWLVWVRHRDSELTEKTLTRRLTYKQDLILAIIVATSGIVYYCILDAVGGTVPLLDAYTVAIGIVAVALSAFRYREQYILWLITDVVAVAMYIEFFDPVYLTKKSIYLIMAFVGMATWWKLNRERNAENARSPGKRLRARTHAYNNITRWRTEQVARRRENNANAETVRNRIRARFHG